MDSRRSALKFGVYSALIATAVAGPTIWGPLAVGWAAALESWLWGAIYSEWIASPSLFLLLIGFGLAHYVAPIVTKRFNRRGEFEWVAAELNKQGPDRARFWTGLERAFQRWKDEGKNREIIEASYSGDVGLDFIAEFEPLPQWLPVQPGKILKDEALKSFFHGLAKGDDPLVSFCIGAVFDIERNKKYGEELKFFDPPRAAEVDTARQALTASWEAIGRRIFVDRVLSFDDIAKSVDDNSRLLKLLSVYEAGLILEQLHSGSGAENMFRLAARHWRADEFLWTYRLFRTLGRVIGRATRLFRSRKSHVSDPAERGDV